MPHFNPATWDFRVWGLVEEEKRWTWEEFNRLPRTRLVMDIHCATRWSKFDTVWEGVSVKTMVENGFFKIRPEATHVMQHAEYGFTVNLPLEVVMQENFLLATHFNGEPITPDHGYPLRGVVGHIPGQEGLESPLFLERCEMASLPGVHAARPARFLGAGRIPQPCGCMARGKIWLMVSDGSSTAVRTGFRIGSILARCVNTSLALR